MYHTYKSFSTLLLHYQAMLPVGYVASLGYVTSLGNLELLGYVAYITNDAT